MSEAPVLVEKRDDYIAVVTLNRPDKLNELNAQLCQLLRDTFDALENDDEVRVVVLHGAGDKAFAAGADVSEFHARNTEEQRSAYAQRRICETVADFPKPVIAAIHGFCVGGGCIRARARVRRARGDCPIAGVSRFHTTNGQATFDPSGRWLIIEGVIGFVAVNLIDGSVAHYESHDGGLIGNWSISGGVLEWKQMRAGSATREVKSCPLDELRARWQPGLGPFANGTFQPDLAFVQKWDRWNTSGGRAKAMHPLPTIDAETECAFTVDGNRAAGLLALAVVLTVAVVAGVIIATLSRRGIGSDSSIVFLALVAMIGLAPGLAVAEAWVRHPR